MSLPVPITLHNGLKIYPFRSFDELIESADGSNRILVALNAEKITHANAQTCAIVNRNIGYCDGVGAVMVMHRYGVRDAVKLPGCELWLKVIEHYLPQQKSFYFVGATQQVIEAVVDKLRTEYPGIRIAGYRNGFFHNDDEVEALIDDIASQRPDVVFVAMGSPRQELLMEQMSKRHPAWYQGLGGSFDVYSGRVERAPRWWLDHNLEFAYRLLRQPSRFRRQLFLFKFYFLLRLGKI